MTRVAVARNKFAKGLEPGRTDVEASYKVLELREALERVYFTDAHLVTYLVDGLERQPRVNKAGLALYAKRLTVECLFCDVDNLGHTHWTPETFEAARQQDLALSILSTTGIYYTAHGRRIVQPLAEPLELEVVEAHLQHWLDRLEDAGVPVDKSCKDWTRHFRLPHVKRDGILVRSRCLDLAQMQPVALPPLPPILLDPAFPGVKGRPPLHQSRSPPPSAYQSSTVPERWQPIVPVVAAAVARVTSTWHHLFLALAGAMLKLGVPAEHVPVLNEAISVATHADDRVQDRVNCALTTLKRWRGKEPFAGFGALQEQWPDVARALESAIDALRRPKPLAASDAIVKETRSLEEITAALEAAIERAPPGLTVIKAECGLGKTQAALRVAARRAAKPYATDNAAGLRAPFDSKTSLSVDKNRLAIQCVEELTRMGAANERLFGPLSLLEADGTRVCKFHEAAEPLVAGGQRMQWEICERRNGESKCRHYDNCAAREGRQGDRDARITVGPHALLGALDAEAGSTGLLVIDEVPDFLETVEFGIGDFDEAIKSAPTAFEQFFVNAMLPMLWAWVEFLQQAPEGETIDACEAVHRFTSAVPARVMVRAQTSAQVRTDADPVECARGAPFPQGHCGSAPPILKHQVDLALCDPKWAARIGRVSKVLKTAHHAVTSDYPVVVRVETRRGERRLHITSPREVLARALRRDGAVVVTDANADLHLPILAKVVGYEPRMHVFTAPDGAPIERTMIRTRKATRKEWLDRGKLDPNSSLVHLVRAAFEWAKEDPTTKLVGIITIPLVECVLRYSGGIDTERCAQDWKSMGQPRNALDAFWEALAPTLAPWRDKLLTAHYGATRGLNDMALVDALITLGDPWANLGDARSDAAFLQLEADWEARYAARCRAELEQAHGRLRTVHRTRPGRALHVGAVMPGGSGWTTGRVEVWGRSKTKATMSAEEFAAAVKVLGGVRAAARVLGCSFGTISHGTSGKHPVSERLAMRTQKAVTIPIAKQATDHPKR